VITYSSRYFSEGVKGPRTNREKQIGENIMWMLYKTSERSLSPTPQDRR